MRPFPAFLLLCLSAVGLAVAAELPKSNSPLEAVHIDPADGAQLRNYLKSRTITAESRGKIEEAIARLGSEDFDARLAAERELEALGPSAVTPLKRATVVDADSFAEDDFEVAYRARMVLKRLERVPHAAVARAAVEALVKLDHPENVRVVLDFLPCADNQDVVDAIAAGLSAVAARPGAVDPALADALNHPEPRVRVMVAKALVGQSPPRGLERVQKSSATEADPAAAFELNFALAANANDPDAVSRLIGMTASLPRGQLWQAEDYLTQLAGDSAPKAPFGQALAGREKSQRGWLDWWAGFRPTGKLAAFAYKPRTTGRLLVVSVSYSGTREGRVALLDNRFKPEWEFAIPGTIGDAVLRPNGTVVTAEQGLYEYRVRNRSGELLGGRRPVSESGPINASPLQLTPLADGSLFEVSMTHLLRFTPEEFSPVQQPSWRRPGTTQAVVVHDRSNFYDIRAACPLSGNRVAVIQQNEPFFAVLNADGTVAKDAKVVIDRQTQHGDMAETTPGRLLITEPSRVREFDLATGEAVWTYNVTRPRSVSRLANGNTLMLTGNGTTERVAEVSPGGEVLWEMPAPGGTSFTRVSRH